MSADYRYHPDWPPFLQAILAKPDDDLPRLVAADWLDEHGFADRAEFIRVQIELGRHKFSLPPTLHANNCWCAGCRLRRRERELWPPLSQQLITFDLHQSLFGHDATTSLPTQEGNANAAVVVRRGFVDEIRVPRLGDWIGGECDSCVGRGTVPDGFQQFELECPDCTGTGRTPGIGPAVVAEHPVQVVTVTCKEPARFGPMAPAVLGTPGPDQFQGRDTHFWLTTDERVADLPNRLPVVLRPFLGGHTRDCGPAPDYDVIGHYFDTRESSVVAKSKAMIAWAKAQPVHRPAPVQAGG